MILDYARRGDRVIIYNAEGRIVTSCASETRAAAYIAILRRAAAVATRPIDSEGSYRYVHDLHALKVAP